MTTSTNGIEIQNIANYAAALGLLAWWDLSDTAIAPDHLRAVLAQQQIVDEKGNPIVVPEIDAVSAIKRACGAWGSGRGNSDRYRAEVVAVETAPTTTGQRVIAVEVGILTHRIDTAARENAWEQIEKLRFDAVLMTWAPVTTAHSSSTVHAISAFYAVANELIGFHDHRWIRKNVILPELKAMSAISMRRQGGIYFVPAEHADRMRRLKRVIRAVGNSDFLITAVNHDEDEREAVATGARMTIIGEIEECESKIQEWVDAGKKPRKDAHATTIGDLAELMYRASLYEGILALRLDDLRTRIDTARDAAVALLTAPAGSKAA